MAGFEFGDLAFLQVHRLQLAELEAQIVELGRVARAGAARALDRGAHVLPLHRRVRDSGERGVVTAVGVEQGALLFAAQQGLAFVLAEHFDQGFAEFAQRRGGHRAVVDESAGAAFGVDHAADQAVAGVVGIEQILLAQPGGGGGRVGERKFGTDLGLVLPGAHQRAVGAGADDQAECVDQDRFAGAGFAGQHREAGAEVQRQLVDDREVADVELFKHVPMAACQGLGPSAVCCAGCRSNCRWWDGSAAAETARGRFRRRRPAPASRRSGRRR